MWNGEELLTALQAGGLEIQVKRRDGKGRALVEIVTSGGMRQEVLLTLRPLPGKAPATMATYRTGAPWDVETLQAQGYPLYWAKEWLTAQIAAHKTLTAVEALTGYPRETLNVWKRRHGIKINPHDEAVRAAWATGTYATRAELAAAFDISLPTMRRILKGR